MFQFESPQYLYFLLVIPLLILLFILLRYQRRKRMKRIGELTLINQLTIGVSVRRPIFKFVLCLLALTSIIIMQARPQMGLKIETNQHKGIELMIALDVSNSMLATDVSPNRLDKAKMMVSNIANKLSNDKVGLIVFAGDAYIQMPITSDIVSAQMFLDAINPSMVSTQGTNISDAIQLAMNSFTNQKHVQRAIVIITDGEDHEGKAEDMAAEAAKNGIHIFALGIGTTKGSTIPTSNHDNLRDNHGNIVVTKLNPDICKKIASEGKGVFIQVDNSNIAQDRLYYELNKLEKQELGTTTFSEYDEQFQIFAWIALVLLIIDILIDEKKNPRLSRFNIFRKDEK